MNILIVSAHPEPTSQTNALRDEAVEQLRADGHDVRVGDLPNLPPAKQLQVAAASGGAFAAGSMTADVPDEQAKLLSTDALILNFPFWWLSFPAILKGWVDRVFAYGFAHGVGEHSDKRWGDRFGEGRLAGRRAMLVVTAGGWEPHYGPRGINGPIEDLLFPINHGVLFYPGYEVLPPFVVYQADRLDDDAFRKTADALRDRLRTLFTASPISFRHKNGSDYVIPSMQLRPEAAVP